MPEADSNSIILYDGVCGLCNRLNQFLLKRDRHNQFRFASLQSGFAVTVLSRHGLDPSDLDTVCLIINHGRDDERVLTRSDAIIHVLGELQGIWKFMSLGKFLPRLIRDGIYKLVARYRYRIFGKSDTCMMPQPQYRQKFIEV